MAKGGLSKANAIRQPKLLVVEGNHERDFFESWLITLGITNIQFMPIGGKTLLRDNLAGLVKQKPFLGICSMIQGRSAGWQRRWSISRASAILPLSVLS
jgi:hypothetical protein